LQPRPWDQLKLFAVNGETKASGQNLNYCGAGRPVLGQLLADVESKHGHVHPVATVDDL
jgi:hypothetical protein